MKWSTENIPLLLRHLPQAVHDLMHHEDPALVKRELARLHSKIITPPPGPSPALISVEKSLDPIAQRSAQNIGLLMHDYLNQLSSFDVSRGEEEDLMKHWRRIMLDQPERLASAHPGHWHDERLKAYWQDILAEHRTRYGISEEEFNGVWDDWQRASATGHAIGNPLQLQAMNKKQWQDLVIRTRMHQLKIEPDGYY